ncbi:MAG: transposase, partial [Eubacteriaceae bacterium]|nr:transposase [Eubacteriaceae bacterium]
AKIRDLVSASGGALNAPPKAGMKAGWDFDPSPYRGRNVVERFFGRIKEFRRFATRYDKLLSTYAMFAHLAIIVIFGIRIRA